jgi:very-short-patch-repair endonuclease
MDFLLLLPHGVRVVVEVDGKQHYADEDRASPAKYASLVAADRELQLAGYHVFRFGADELRDAPATQSVVKAFFTALFRTHGVVVS